MHVEFTYAEMLVIREEPKVLIKQKEQGITHMLKQMYTMDTEEHAYVLA